MIRQFNGPSRFIVLICALGCVAIGFGPEAATLLAPAIAQEIQLLAPVFRVDRVEVARVGNESVIRLEVGLAHSLKLNGHVVPPNPRGRANAYTPVAHLTAPAVLMLSLAYAWPTRCRGDWRWRALLMWPCLMLLAMLGVPLILLGALWGLAFQALDPQGVSLLDLWSGLLLGGGEWALALSIGAALGAATGPPIVWPRVNSPIVTKGTF